MIGNDIIDLNELHRHPRSDQVRFLRKILSASEMDRLRFSEEVELDIWKLWAVKESAYKCYFQRTYHRFFAPRKFICRWDPPSGTDHWQARVFTPIGPLYAELYQTRDYFHALCSDERSRLAQARVHLWSIPETNARLQSDLVRKKGLSQIAEYIGCPTGELSWDDDAGHPRVRQQGVLLPVGLSLSHHGRWGAAVFWSEEGRGRVC